MQSDTLEFECHSECLQGFSKQNYTMLDNLKLGYGGTKEEMERLLANAQAISGVEYNIDSYADVVEAIHVMQESMSIAGTTAKKAEATISGSVNALKSAVTNLIVGFGDADADMELLCNNMVDAFKTVVANITPVIENIVAALPTALDALLTAVGELLPTLVTGIADALPTPIPAAVQAIVTIVQGLVDSLPMLLDAALQLITGLAQGLLDTLPVLIAALPEIIMAIVEAIPQIISGIVNALVGNIDKIIMAGVQLFVALIENLPTIIVEIGGNIVKGLWSGIQQLASWLWDKVSGWISYIWDGICDFFGIHSPSKEMAWVGEMLVKGLAGSIDDNGDEAVKAAEGMAKDINGVMGDLAHDMQTALPTDFDVNGSIRSAVDGVVGKAASAFTIALNISTFNNYSREDSLQLTNEVMETAILIG